MVSGFQELLHLVQCTLDFGPMNSFSCFQFEELNRKIKQMVNGRFLIGEEFVKIFTVMQSLEQYNQTCEFKNQKLYDFVKENCEIKSTNHFKNQVKKVKVWKTKKLLCEEIIEFNSSLNIDLSLELEYYSVEIISLDDVKFTTTKNDSLFCDYCVKKFLKKRKIDEKFNHLKTLRELKNDINKAVKNPKISNASGIPKTSKDSDSLVDSDLYDNESE